MNKSSLVLLCLVFFALCEPPVHATYSQIVCQDGLAQDKIDSVLSYWFGSLPSDDYFPEDKMGLWFGKDAKVDQEIKRKFEKDVIKASYMNVSDGPKSPRGRLALIILLDQFTRNIYRDTPAAFAFDQLAQQLTLEGISHGDDLKLHPVERIFFYLPLEHAENKQLQEMSVRAFEQLAQDGPGPLQNRLNSFLLYSQKHKEIVDRFGRFPHRNKILGRASTDEEKEFLRQPGSSF